MVGGLVTLRWRPRHALFVGTCFLALTAAFPLAMAWSDSLVVVLLGAFLHGFGLEIFSVGWDLSIQEQVDPDKLARVYSFDMIGSFIARPVGLVLTGPLAALVGNRALAHRRGRGDRGQRARRPHLRRRTPAPAARQPTSPSSPCRSDGCSVASRWAWSPWPGRSWPRLRSASTSSASVPR